MVKQHIILGILWISFCCLHSLLASVAVKKSLRRYTKTFFKNYRLYYTLFAFVTFAGVLVYQLRLTTILLFSSGSGLFVTGGIIFFTGLILMLVCIRKYFGQLSGLKTLFTDELTTGNHLLITGVHRWVRHPLYLGTFLFIWGLFILLPYASLLVSNCVITVYTLIGIRLEESKLKKEFGQQYAHYQKNVPMLFPKIRLVKG